MAVIDLERVDRIKQILKWNPRGMTISDLTKKMQINRNLIAKNLDMLVISGQVEMQPIGTAKVYFLSKRVPVSSMLEFSSDLVIMVDQQGKIVYTNEHVPALLDISRGRPDRKKDRRNRSSLPAGSRGVYRIGIPKTGTGKEDIGQISSSIRNVHRYFRTKKVPTAFEDGSQGFTFIIEDITAQITYQQKLELSEAQYRGLVRSSGEAIIGSTEEGKITSWNHAAQRVFGYTETEIVEQHFSQLVPAKTHADLDRLLQDIRNGDCVQRREMKILPEKMET